MKIFKNKKVIVGIIICIILIIGIVTAILLINNKEEEPKETIILKDNLDTEISIVDTQAPTIEYEKELSTTEGTEIDLLKDVKVKDNSNEEIKATIEGEYDINKAGTYNLKYVAIDSSNNKAEEEFTLTVNEKPKETVKETQKSSTTSNTSKSTNNNTSSNSNESTVTNNQSSEESKYYSQELPLYTFVDEYTWKYNNGAHIRRITYHWYVNYIERDSEGNVDYVEWGVSCDSGMGMPACESAKSYMPTPPSGQEAVNMYNADNNVRWGHTILYTVIP